VHETKAVNNDKALSCDVEENSVSDPCFSFPQKEKAKDTVDRSEKHPGRVIKEKATIHTGRYTDNKILDDTVKTDFASTNKDFKNMCVDPCFFSLPYFICNDEKFGDGQKNHCVKLIIMADADRIKDALGLYYLKRNVVLVCEDSHTSSKYPYFVMQCKHHNEGEPHDRKQTSESSLASSSSLSSFSSSSSSSYSFSSSFPSSSLSSSFPFLKSPPPIP
jgi:hypothetical protein